MRNKGILSLMIGLVIFLIFYIFVITILVGNNTITKRTVAENELILTGSKVETYVKSYLSSLRLSLLQAIYDTGNSYSDKNWQCYAGYCLAEACILDSEDKESIRKDILDSASSYADSYLSAYDKFPANANPKVEVPSTIGNSIRWSIDNDDGNSIIYFKWSDASFTLEDEKVNIDREFTPETKVDTVFRLMYDASESMISDNDILDVVTSAISGLPLGKSEEAVVQSNSCPSIDTGVSCGCTPPCTTTNPKTSVTVSCSSGGSCTSVAQKSVCVGSQFDSETVFQCGYKKSTGTVKGNIISNIDPNLNRLEEVLSNSDYTFDFTSTNKKSDITVSCSISNDGCCRSHLKCTESGCTCVCDTSWKTTTCTYTYRGAVTAKTDVTETAYPKYALWDGIGVIQDSLHLKYTVTSGNDPSLISCNVWTR